MNIAVACNGLDVAKHFDQTECFTCYSVSKGIMSGCRTLPNLNLPIAELCTLFKSLGIDVLICGRIESQDSACFLSQGIDVVSNEFGSASSQAEKYLTGHLSGDDFEED